MSNVEGNVRIVARQALSATIWIAIPYTSVPKVDSSGLKVDSASNRVLLNSAAQVDPKWTEVD